MLLCFCSLAPSLIALLLPPFCHHVTAISYTDYNIGVIVDALDAMEGLRDKTAVVVFGDHGE